MSKLKIILLLLLFSSRFSAAQDKPDNLDIKGLTAKVEYFKLSDVRLLASPFLKAQEIDEAYMMKLNPDRLLAPYLTEAGLPAKAKNYPNWESEGLDGHIAGHYLSALSMMYASTGDKKLLQRLNYMISELKRCQDQDSSGYLGGIPNGKEMWAKVKAGDVAAIKTRWVPWYNLHKLFAGLRDAYEYTGNQTAKDMLLKLSDWCWHETEHLSETQMQTMLQTEYGGMNEVLADVAAISGDPKYLQLARRFSKHSLLYPLEKEEDNLTGLHANTQIPIVIGAERIADLSANNTYQNAASFFWHTVVNYRTVVFGGNSVEEHFNPIDDYSSMLTTPQGPETCNTYNMLKLTRMLYQYSDDLKYIDYYERALYNHILSSENLQRGGFVYFTPIRPESYRVYSQPQNSFWCCVGTGMENHSKYGAMIYAHTKDALLVNLFIPSVLNWKEKGLTVIQKNHFPDEDYTILTIKTKKPVPFDLKIRYPSWVAKDSLRISINGKDESVNQVEDSYVAIRRTWKTGDRIKIILPMRTKLVDLPGNSGYVAIMHGPIVLSAKTGTADMKGEFADTSRFSHIPSGKSYPLNEAPELVGSKAAILAAIKPVEGNSMEFNAKNVIYPAKFNNLPLIPFFRIGGSRYMIYWKQVGSLQPSNKN